MEECPERVKYKKEPDVFVLYAIGVVYFWLITPKKGRQKGRG